MALNNPIFRGAGNGGGGGLPDIPVKRIIMWVLVAAVLLIIVSVAGCGIKVVNTGHRGIETHFGKVVSESLPEGLYFYNPVTSNIVEMDTRIQRQDSETDTYTRDVQQAAIKYTLNY